MGGLVIGLQDAAHEMAARTHLKAQTLLPKTPAERVFALYLERFLGLIEGALALMYADDYTPSVVLIRGALECYVDFFNLARDGEDYLLVLRAMLLEGRSAIFHFKTKGLYEHFVEELGQAGANRQGKMYADQLAACVKEATERYPMLRYSARNLTVYNRFRIAGMEDKYHTLYAWLSMQAHNSLEPLLIGEAMRSEGETMDEAQDGIGQAVVVHFAVEMLVDTLKCIETLFGKDDAFTKSFLELLEEVSQG